MRYRIKKITTSDNEIYYIVEKCIFSLFGIWCDWKYIDDAGFEFHYYIDKFKFRENCLKVIDINYEKSKVNNVKSIEIEYVTKL